MTVINRREPPIVPQELNDSCWAAAIESWSRVEPRIVRQSQSTLISRWGEGETGGITPNNKIPIISDALNLQWGGFAGSALGDYLTQHLPSSHVFCAYSISGFLHSVMIYRFSESRNVSYMDPNGGSYRWRSLNWLSNHGPFVLMRKP